MLAQQFLDVLLGVRAVLAEHGVGEGVVSFFIPGIDVGPAFHQHLDCIEVTDES